MYATDFDTFFHDAPPIIDVGAIRAEWQALAPFYDVGDWQLPLPPWRHQPYQDSGAQAWDTLRQDLARDTRMQPFCIYMHVPFCSSKCGFCDNYSFRLGSHQDEHITAYVDRLCYEMALWREQGNLSQRPVSTMHMGGGTPTFLGPRELARVVACCRDSFATSDATEWALESTVEALTPDMIATMHALGFRRLHVGVQSLEDGVRAAIGRRKSATEVLQTIAATLARGWVVSVDLICGLPGQTLAGFLEGIETLIALGVNGFSLYELLIFPQNARWSTRHGLTDPRRHQQNYWMFVAGASLLAERSFRNNLFNHWADARDANIYFTFPSRGEDLLALGTIADGVFGDYHYRHPRYAPYLATARDGLPGLEGGLRRDSGDNHLQSLTTALLSGHIPAQYAAALDRRALRERWQACGLVRPNGAGLDLTPSGSWFAGNLVAELYA